jgi:hypothetical protein
MFTTHQQDNVQENLPSLQVFLIAKVHPMTRPCRCIACLSPDALLRVADFFHLAQMLLTSLTLRLSAPSISKQPKGVS